MAKMTILDMVQDILNDLDSDEVNSIDDTVEAQQVAQIIKTCYFEMIDNRNWPHLKKLTTLDHVGNLELPNYLKVPDNMKELTLLKYETFTDDGSYQYRDLKYKYPDEFLKIVGNKPASNTNMDTVIDPSGIRLYVINNADPTYWTSFDDTYIVCDAYNKEKDDTLKADKTQCIAYMNPTWLVSDDFIPDLPSEAFSALLEEAKSTAFNALKQVVNQKAEQKAGRQQRWLSRKAWKSHGGVRYPDYGRKSRTNY